MFEEGLHGVMVGLGQLIHQLFDALHSLPVVKILCRNKNKKHLKPETFGSFGFWYTFQGNMKNQQSFSPNEYLEVSQGLHTFLVCAVKLFLSQSEWNKWSLLRTDGIDKVVEEGVGEKRLWQFSEVHL